MTDDSPTSEKRPYVHILRNVSPGPLLDIAARWHCPHLPPGSEVSEMLLKSIVDNPNPPISGPFPFDWTKDD